MEPAYETEHASFKEVWRLELGRLLSSYGALVGKRVSRIDGVALLAIYIGAMVLLGVS